MRLSRLLALALSLGSAAACGKPAVSVRPSRPAAAMLLKHTLIPAPASYEPRGGEPFELARGTRVIVTAPGAERIGAYLARLIAAPSGPASRVELLPGGAAETGAIVLDLDRASGLAAEGYRLSASPARVVITASTPAGMFYGVQTLRQLLPASVEYEAARRRVLRVPAVEIADAPRFAWRGAMLDVARHFFGVEDVTRLIDLMALHKMNRLHLHLSDDQGWRIEIDAWPNLTRHGGTSAVGGGQGGFYTKAQYAAIVAYAAERFIEIVPEIDMPGHTNAALASYAELNCDGQAPPLFTGIEVGFSTVCVDADVTYRFIDDIVREIGAISPGPFFHIGGDEVRKLTPEQYAAFISRAESIVRAHGKRMIGWDEVAAVTLQRDSVIQLWRPDNPKGDLAQTGSVIYSPANKVYLDMKYTAETAIGLEWAARIEVRDAYDWDPATLHAGVREEAVLGVEAPLWTETVARRADIEYLMFPRLAGVAEIGWTPQRLRVWDDYRLRLAAQEPRWTALGINFYRSPQVPW